jgi:hypothetical protein
VRSRAGLQPCKLRTYRRGARTLVRHRRASALRSADGQAADVWALGAITFSMMTGEKLIDVPAQRLAPPRLPRLASQWWISS